MKDLKTACRVTECLMKIYLFEPESGVYLGEDFSDDAYESGEDPERPIDFTTIKPPPADSGQILVFNIVNVRWEVRSAR